MSKTNVFGPLKNIANSKVPLVYKAKPRALLDRKVSPVPEPEDLVHPFFRLTELDAANIALDRKSGILSELKLPFMEQKAENDNYLMKFVTLQNNASKVYSWVNAANKESVSTGGIHGFKTVEELQSNDTSVHQRIESVTINEQEQKLIDDFFSTPREAPHILDLDSFANSALQLNLKENSFEYTVVYLINSAPPTAEYIVALITYASQLLQQEVESGISVSKYYTSLFIRALVNKISKNYSSWQANEKAKVKNAIHYYINSVESSLSNGSLKSLEPVVLHQIFECFVLTGNLKKARLVLLQLLENQVLPSKHTFISYVRSACLDERPYIYLHGLKKLLEYFNCPDIVRPLVKRSIFNFEELQILLNFIDRAPQSAQIYQEVAADIIKKSISMLYKKSNTGKRRATYLLDIVIRLERNGVILNDDLKTIIIKFLVSSGSHYRTAFPFFSSITSLNQKHVDKITSISSLDPKESVSLQRDLLSQWLADQYTQKV